MTKQCYFCNKVIGTDSLYCTYCGNKDITEDEIADIKIYLKKQEEMKQSGEEK